MKIVIYAVLAVDQTGYKLIKTFSKEEDARKCMEDLKELLWRVTLYKTYCDEYK